MLNATRHDSNFCELNVLLVLCFTDRLSSHMGWRSLPNPSFPCRRSANSQQKSVSPNLSGHYCCRSVKNALVMGCGFFGETWLDPKGLLVSFFVRLKCLKKFGLFDNKRLYIDVHNPETCQWVKRRDQIPWRDAKVADQNHIKRSDNGNAVANSFSNVVNIQIETNPAG